LSELTIKLIKDNIARKEKEVTRILALFTGFQTETVNESLTYIKIFGRIVGRLVTEESERSKTYKVKAEVVGDPYDFAMQITEGLKMYHKLLEEEQKRHGKT